MSLLSGTRTLRLPRLRSYVPQPDDPRIFWFNSERDHIIEEVVRRIMERHGDADDELEQVLNDVAYHEVRRLERQGDNEAGRNVDFWRGVIRRLGRMSPEGKHEMLRSIAESMARDVAGNFDPRVYRLAVKMVPSVLTAVMQPASLLRKMLDTVPNRLDDLIATEGPLEKIRRLSRIGTIILAPTHTSNLDSLAIGWALHRDGMPPMLYGAGKNLFSNPIISFFMHNLGAYRVDRRIKARLYKQILKAYSCIMLERGYHSLFFPGGTRSRSGAVESRVKLGLAGTGVEAFSRNHARGAQRPMFFVPATMNHALVLEAETLIEDYLTEKGRERYIIEDDEFSRLERWVAYLNRLKGLDCACILRFGEPMDPFCNPVDDEGRSLAPSGQVVDPGTYVSRSGSTVVDHARDAAYTHELGIAMARSFVNETVVMASQLVAHVIFRRLVRATPGVDLFGRLRYRGAVAIPHVDLVHEIGQARDALIELELDDKVHASSTVRQGSPERLLEYVLTAWNGYHSRDVARIESDAVIVEDPSLLLYYQNRLQPFAQELADEENRAAAREIATMELRK
jgi:glycerol-3-phosphate O-acyltransferase